MDFNAPIYNAIKDYKKREPSRFHTPGHSGVNIDGFLYQNAFSDITELSFSDNLQCPSSIISSSEKLMAESSGAKDILYLTSGGTSAIFIALSVISNYGKKIIVDNNAHKSIYSAARMLGIEVIRVNYSDIINKINTLDDIAAVIVTSPDYFGKVKDYEKLSDKLKDKDIIFVIDHSHGAHFMYSNKLPHSSISHADLVIVSLHKTLPIITGGAMLAINSNKLLDLSLYYRMTLHSTSPSYQTLASIDFARAFMELNGNKLYDMLIKRVEMIGDELKGTDYYVEHTDDKTRLVINCRDKSSYSVSIMLEKQNIYCEMAEGNRLVFILTPFNAENITKLINSLREIKVSETNDINIYDIAHKKASATGAIEFVRLENSLGRVAVNEIGLYPPGIPIITSGDVINSKTIELLKAHRKCIFGLVKDMVPVLK